MVTEQETLIYIENQDKHDASVAANAFAHKDVKNRAYINTLGAELALKYLASENIDVSNIHNIHSIRKILEEIDISDIMLSNIHIDVRVIFDENAIFIPKSHFEYNLVPDIYLVLSLAKDFSHVKFLGFFEPKLINKNNANDKYYFIEKEKLSAVKDLKQFIDNFKGNTAEELPEKDLTKCERIIVSMADNDISDIDKKYLIKQLVKSAELRDKFLEYENFETLSYKAMTDPQVDRKNIEKKLTFNQVENLADTNTQEAIDNLADIETLEQTTITTDTAAQSDNILEDIASLTAGTAAAETFAAAQTEEEDAQEPMINLDDELISSEPTMNIESGAVDVSPANTEEEPVISFDNVDTSMLDDIAADTEEFEEQTISLNDVETQDNNVKTDFIDTIDNNISFDDVVSAEPLEEPSIVNIDDAKFSFDNIDTSSVSPELDFEENASDNKISFDNIELPPEENDNQPLNYEEETISFKKLEDPLPDYETNDFLDDVVTLDDIPAAEETETIQNIEEEPELTSNDTVLEDANSEEISLEDIGNINEINNDIENPISESNDVSETSNEIITDTIKSEEPEIIENVTDEHNDTFGKNLLDNLNPENLDDISIESLGLTNDDDTTANAQNISSDDLLSQVDDLLAVNTPSETPAPEQETVQQETNEQDDSEFDNIPDLESFDDMPSITNTAEEQNTNQEESIDSIDNLLNDDSSDNIDDIEISEETDNSSIDELLNTELPDDNNQEEDNPDNIGVLFNDTDPVTDAELDNMDEFVPEEQYQENTAQIPGAAVYRKSQKGNKNALIVAAALIAVIAAASAIMVFKPKNDNTADIEPIAPQTAGTETTENPLAAAEAPAENVLATNAPDIKNTQATKTEKTKQPAKELKNTALKPKPASAQSYPEVSKLVWDVPDTLSYSPKMQSYLRTAGKSIKLSLSADLLLATEYAYKNQVKVGLKISKDGSILESGIISSSGSNQIDQIVLQSVKDTLNVVKPPSNEIKSPDFNLSLIINF